MRRKSYEVTGERVTDLVPALRETLDPEHEYGGDGVDVLFAEEFEFWRTKSNMGATVVLDRKDDATYHLEVVVSGGATGILKTTFGSEGKVLDAVCEKLRERFDDLGLQVTEFDEPTVPIEYIHPDESDRTLSEPTEVDEESPQRANEPEPDPECATCSVAFGSVAFQCDHCSELYCSDHRTPDEHDCHGTETSYSTVPPKSVDSE